MLTSGALPVTVALWYYATSCCLAIPVTLLEDYQKNVSLLKHAMAGDQHWAHVFQEKIVKTVEPPFQDTYMRDELVAADERVIDPHSVVARILESFINIGSFVEYGVLVLSTSFCCLALKHMSFQVYVLYVMIAKGMTPEAVFTQLNVMTASPLVLFVDKMGVMHKNSVAPVIRVYAELQRLGNTKVPADLDVFPRDAAGRLMVQYNLVQTGIQSTCAVGHAKDYFGRLGFDVPAPLLDNATSQTVSHDDLRELLWASRTKMIEIHNSLELRGMHTILWNDILHFAPDNPYWSSI